MSQFVEATSSTNSQTLFYPTICQKYGHKCQRSQHWED